MLPEIVKMKCTQVWNCMPAVDILLKSPVEQLVIVIQVDSAVTGSPVLLVHDILTKCFFSCGSRLKTCCVQPSVLLTTQLENLGSLFRIEC